jgi:predicted Rossmann-fold nucleotide-binding protein
MGSEYWAGLLAWIVQKMRGGGKIEEAEARLLHIVDRPQDVCRIALEANSRQRALYEEDDRPHA